MESGAFFHKENFVFWWGLRPRLNLPRPWAGPVIMKALGEDGVSLASFDPLIQDAKFFSSSFS